MKSCLLIDINYLAKYASLNLATTDKETLCCSLRSLISRRLSPCSKSSRFGWSL